ncbi:hypothetical protein V8C26DRAFT_152457 [Trichoderma gracile]
MSERQGPCPVEYEATWWSGKRGLRRITSTVQACVWLDLLHLLQCFAQTQHWPSCSQERLSLDANIHIHGSRSTAKFSGWISSSERYHTHWLAGRVAREMRTKGAAGNAHVTRGHSTIRTDYEKLPSNRRKPRKSHSFTKHGNQPGTSTSQGSFRTSTYLTSHILWCLLVPSSIAKRQLYPHTADKYTISLRSPWLDRMQ